MMPFRRIAVLGRTNARNLVISQELERSRIPCYTVELFEFFRRQEIKDALAILKLLVRPEDRWSLGRVLLRPPRGIGEATVRQIRTEGERSGLRLTDMVSPLLERDGEPFGRLIREADSGHLVILDVESTGLSLGQDEVVEIAATRLHGGRPGETFHRFIKNTVPVGESQSIHGWSDKFLQREGESPAEAFSALVNLIGASPVVGHYVRFDLGLIRAHARRVGVIVPEYETFDTWSMSSRLLPNLFDYRLETICQALHVKFRPQHKAEADVTATAELLLKLLPKIKEGAVERWGICSQYAGLFAPLAAMLSGLRAEINSLRPVEILERALALSGLYAYYEGKKESRRLEHLARLAAIFREKDDLSAAPQDALAMLVEYAALAKNVDHILEGDDKVPIITMHQAKGLEFDVVFIAGASEGEIPSYLSLKEGRLEEEKRLFYVAMTRARKELYISSYSTHEKGFAKQPSRFISDIPANLVERL
jgi:DNA helicase-2/ATP-dependent DNA helicase PcrA